MPSSPRDLGPFPSRRLFRRELARICRHPTGKWWLSDNLTEGELEEPRLEGICLEVERLGALARLLLQPDTIPVGTVLKQDPTRLVFRWKPAEQAADWVIKAYYARSWRRGLRYRRHAYREAASLLCARARNLPVPATYGYGELRGPAGLRCAAVCTQRMRLQSLRSLFLERPDSEAVSPLLSRASALLLKLYRGGCNHVDFGPHAIMISPRSSREDVLIDFESAAFLPHPSPRLLAAQAGYFAWSVATNRDWVKQERMEHWFADVLRQLEIPSSAELWDLWHTCLRVRQPLKWRVAIR